jgi:hypothetical protein
VGSEGGKGLVPPLQEEDDKRMYSVMPIADISSLDAGRVQLLCPCMAKSEGFSACHVGGVPSTTVRR